jgi:hypothetical protein
MTDDRVPCSSRVTASAADFLLVRIPPEAGMFKSRSEGRAS